MANKSSKAAAASLRKQIDQLTKGETLQPTNLRDFIAKKMSESKRKKKK